MESILSYIGWVVVLNMAAVMTVIGWIPHFAGIDAKTYMIWAFFISLPIALWCEIKGGDC